jgi:large subunit ribosomal protein L18
MSIGQQQVKRERAVRRRMRTRSKIRGTSQRPRLNVARSLRGLYVQLIDDDKGKTLLGLSLVGMKVEAKGDKKQHSHELGKAVAAKAKELGIETVVFDRGRYSYHGRIKSFAEGARKGGLKF